LAESDTITIYWAPASFTAKQDAWNLIYRKPESLMSFIHGEKTPGSFMSQCPAMKDTLKNVFVFKSAMDDHFDINPQDLVNLKQDDSMEFIHTNSIVGLRKYRPNQLKGYVNIMYNMGWFFFADQPVVAKMTAPYYPAFTPIKDALFAAGEFNIGKWFRGFDMDFHVPPETNRFDINVDDPLFFMHLDTDKKVVFKRFLLTEELVQMGLEFSTAPAKYGRHKTLEERYEIADDVEYPAMVLKLVKEAAVD
jgi:hypothetical protein